MLVVRPVVAPLLLRRSLPAAIAPPPRRLPSCCSRSFCAAAQASRFEREQQSYASEAPRRPWLPKPRKQPRKQQRQQRELERQQPPLRAPAPERVAKRLARVGLCSRKEAEAWIAEGRVRIDGVVATAGSVAAPGCALSVDGAPVPSAPAPRLFLYHKPRQVIVTRRDHRDKNRRTIAEELAELGLPETLQPVGRLDYMTSGLMLLTNDGELARGLEMSSMPRTYRVKAYGGLHRQKLTSLQRHGRLRLPARRGAAGATFEGVRIREIAKPKGGKAPKRAAGQPEPEPEPEPERGGRTGRGGGGGGTRWLEVTLHEGKNREVRQIIEHLGLGVSKLERVRFGPYRLGWLQPGDVLRARMKPEVKRLVGANWDWG